MTKYYAKMLTVSSVRGYAGLTVSVRPAISWLRADVPRSHALQKWAGGGEASSRSSLAFPRPVARSLSPSLSLSLVKWRRVAFSVSLGTVVEAGRICVTRYARTIGELDLLITRLKSTWPRRSSHDGAAASPSSSSVLFERRGARYRLRYEQSRAIQISRRSMRNSRDLYRRPLQFLKFL